MVKLCVCVCFDGDVNIFKFSFYYILYDLSFLITTLEKILRIAIVAQYIL